MAIRIGSRYQNSTVDFVQTSLKNTDLNPIVFWNMSTKSNISYFNHTYTYGERLDEIAFDYYQDPSYWWMILEYNPQIKDINNIPVGTVLRIPRV